MGDEFWNEYTDRAVGKSGDRATLEEFKRFHNDNMHIYTRLVRLAHQARNNGVKRLGMQMLIEVVRWDHMITTKTTQPFKINNNYAAYYARLIEYRVPRLHGFFTKRKSRADGASLLDAKGIDND